MFAPVSFLINDISASCQPIAYTDRSSIKVWINHLKSAFCLYRFLFSWSIANQASKSKGKNLWIPSAFLPASLQILLKDRIKLNQPASISSISAGTTGNKPSWSNVSTFIDSKCNLSKGRRQNTRRSCLESEKPLASLWKSDCPCTQYKMWPCHCVYRKAVLCTRGGAVKKLYKRIQSTSLVDINAWGQ